MATHSKQRRPRRFQTISEDTASQAIGPLTAGTEIYGMTDDSLNLIDVIAHCMSQTDSRDVTMATWTAAHGSLKALRDLCRSRAIRSLRLIVDPSFHTRKPEDAAELTRLYGPDCIRYIPIHGKFCVMSGGRLPVTIRSSMNINPNQRIETYEISTCPEIAAFHAAFADDVFGQYPAPDGTKPPQNDRPISKGAAFTPPRPVF